jgi:hypothetical protein
LDQIDRRELPGNDASWYEALVAEQTVAPGDETATVALATAADVDDTAPVDDATPVDDEAATESSVAIADVPSAPEHQEPSEGDAAVSPTPEPKPPLGESLVVTAVEPVEQEEAPLENTSEMVGQLWTAPDHSGPLDDWKPDDMDRKVSSSRSFRWSTVIGILAVVGLIAVGLVVLPSITQSRADEHLTMITTTLRDLRAELPDSQTSLSVATDPASTTTELSGLTTQLTELAAKASALDRATQAELPKAPPLTSSAPIDEIEPIRQRAEPLGTTTLSIQRRISNVVEYRTLMDGFLDLPELPTSADSATQAELRVQLASAQAASASILAELPYDVSLEEHKILARDTIERFATWQVDYLEALRTGNTIAAEELIAELESDLQSLDEALVTPLAQIRRQTDADLIDLARDIDAVVAMADQTAAG